ncbi:redoxin domain-containing protein [Paenibacillus sp. IITD108]|uniref:redoxin domain-containing protein n=1 Tax=Paenibacillus sp. IITD108 TaxID=3116649 RepID=UPI002F4085A0
MKKIRTAVVSAAIVALAVWGYLDIQDKQARDKEAASLQQEQEKKILEQNKQQDVSPLIKGGLNEEASIAEKEKKVPVIGLKKGNVAPDFILESLDGEKRKLSDYRGKKVMVNLWATWCPPCREEMPDMQAYYEQYQSDDMEIFAVNLTSSEKSMENIENFVQRNGLSFPILLDSDDQVSSRYEVFQIPTTYILNAEGEIEQKIIGPMNLEIMEQLMQ